MSRYQDIVEFEEQIIEQVKTYIDEQDLYSHPALLIKREDGCLVVDITDTAASIDTATAKTYPMADLVQDNEPDFDAIYEAANEWIFLD